MISLYSLRRKTPNHSISDSLALYSRSIKKLLSKGSNKPKIPRKAAAIDRNLIFEFQTCLLSFNKT